MNQASGGGGGSASSASKAQIEAVQDAFASSSQDVFYAMAAAMALALIVAIVGLPKGKAPEAEVTE